MTTDSGLVLAQPEMNAWDVSQDLKEVIVEVEITR